MILDQEEKGRIVTTPDALFMEALNQDFQSKMQFLIDYSNIIEGQMIISVSYK